MAVKKEYRDLVIGSKFTESNKVVPFIRMSGLWLEELGFQCGGYMRVKCENGQLIITPNYEKAEEVAAEKEFMEKETAKLKEQFEREKKEIHARYVAEQMAKYETAKGGKDSV